MVDRPQEIQGDQEIRARFLNQKKNMKAANKYNEIWTLKKISIFFGKGPPLCRKLTKIFIHPNMTIHTPLDSPCRVYKKLVVFGKFYFDYWSEIS